MSGKLPYMPLYIGDLKKDPCFRRLAPADKWHWLDLIFAMWEDGRAGEMTGSVAELGRVISLSPADMALFLWEVQRTGVGDLEPALEQANAPENAIVTVKNRRMKRDANERKAVKDRVDRHRKNKRNADGNEPVTQESAGSSSSQSESENEDLGSGSPPDPIARGPLAKPLQLAIPAPPELTPKRRVGLVLAKGWEALGLLTPDAYFMGEASRLVTEYGAAGGRADLEALAAEALAAGVRYVESWSFGTALTPKLFCDKWDQIQGVLGGVEPGRKTTEQPTNAAGVAYGVASTAKHATKARRV